MPISRDIALTVEEREGLFHWVLLEACEVPSSDAMHYRPLQSAAAAQGSYSSALALGMAELKRVTAPDAATG